jgi:hypothetical protein
MKGIANSEVYLAFASHIDLNPSRKFPEKACIIKALIEQKARPKNRWIPRFRLDKNANEKINKYGLIEPANKSHRIATPHFPLNPYPKKNTAPARAMVWSPPRSKSKIIGIPSTLKRTNSWEYFQKLTLENELVRVRIAKNSSETENNRYKIRRKSIGITVKRIINSCPVGKCWAGRASRSSYGFQTRPKPLAVSRSPK